jgi:nucleoside transporter
MTDTSVLRDAPATTQAPAYVRTRLSVMMFLELFVWGAWYVTCGNFMAAHGMKSVIYLAYAVGPIAAIISPFFLGIVADRFFASERVLSVLHVIGAAAMFATAAAGAAQMPGLFIAMLLLHMLAYMPTLALTTTISLHQLTNPEKEFPPIRVFGTFGWIAANLVVSTLLKGDDATIQFYVTGAAALILAVFSLALPHTPAPAKGQPVSARAILGLDAVSLMKSPSFAIFIISSFLICIPLATYFAYAPVFASAIGFKAPGAALSLGQVSEVFFMLVMPIFFVRLGVKYMLLLAMAAWAVRYAFFAAAAPGKTEWMVIAGVLLHGVSYDFFFVTGFIYADKQANPETRGQVQGFLVLVTQGLGMLVGAWLSGVIFNSLVVGQGATLLRHWQEFWLIPSVAALIIMIIFYFAFRDTVVDKVRE